MEQANSMEFIELTTELTVKKAVEGTKIMQLKRELGFGRTLKSITLLIWDVVNFFNLPEGKSMKEIQVMQTAQFILEDYPIFSIEDIAMAFKNGKKGKYGKNYATIDGQILIGWIKSYDQERDAELVMLNKIDTSRKPIIPDFVAENLYQKFGGGEEEFENKKSKEEEFRKFKLEYQKNAILRQNKVPERFDSEENTAH